MKLVVQVRLYPNPEQVAALKDTLTACSAAAHHAALVLHEQKPRTAFDLQKLVYTNMKTDVRLVGTTDSAVLQESVRRPQNTGCVAPVGPDGKARQRAPDPDRNKPVEFRADAAQPFDDRCLSYQIPADGTTAP